MVGVRVVLFSFWDAVADEIYDSSVSEMDSVNKRIVFPSPPLTWLAQ